jgi:hypothetical protein
MIEELRAEGFIEMSRVREPVGVYVLIDRGTVVYVGQSTNIYARLARHSTNAKPQRVPRLVSPPPDVRLAKSMVFDRVAVRWCSRGELDRIEIELIDRFRPKYNKLNIALTGVGVDLSDIAAKLGWDKRRKPPVSELRRRVA